MRTLISLVIALLFVVPAVFASDSTVTFRPYAGVFYAGQYDSKLNFAKSGDLWVGAEAQLPGPGSYGTVTVRGAYKTSDAPVLHVWFTGPIGGDLCVLGGFMPRPIAVLRPNPVSDGAQFEPPAKAVIPGAATGLGLRSGDFSTTYRMAGVYYLPEKKAFEYGVGVKDQLFGGISVETGIFLSTRGKYGVASTVSGRYFSGTVFGESDSLQSIFLKAITSWGEPYLTLVHNRASMKDDWEIGWTNVWVVPDKPVSVLLGLGYDHPRKLGKIYLQVFI